MARHIKSMTSNSIVCIHCVHLVRRTEHPEHRIVRQEDEKKTSVKHLKVEANF